MKAAILAALCVLAVARPAHARRAPLITTGEEIQPIRTIDNPGDLPFAQLGYHYEYAAILFVDVWRWGGEFVVFSGDQYVVLDDADLARIGGASTPWDYRLPIGFVILLGLGEFVVITATKQKLGVVLPLGIGLGLAAILAALAGMRLQALVPAALAAHHLLGSWFVIREEDAKERERAAETTAAPPAPATERPPARPSAPSVPAPISVERPDPAPAPAAPIVRDDSAAPPKLLG